MKKIAKKSNILKKKRSSGIVSHRHFPALIVVSIISCVLIFFAFLSSQKLQSVFADSASVNFESPTYTVGSINGQDGWKATGSAGSGCAIYDQAVATQSSYPSFGSQSLRISDAVTSGCFGDQVFAKPLVDSVGEASASAGTFSVGNKQTHFEMQFDLASVVPAVQQPGLHVSVSPDRGDGSRMSYLRFEDGASGINVFFDDVQGTTNPANFVETQIGTDLNRTIPHKIKLTMDTLDGPSNDVVKVWIDGTLVITGTSWENYYRFDSEAAAEQSPRIVKTVIFRSSGTAIPGDAGKGFYFDNLILTSGPVLVAPTSEKQCKKNGWKLFNNPVFKNQGQCEKYVEKNKKDEDKDKKHGNRNGEREENKHFTVINKNHDRD